ncbi:AAA family ATPase [Bacillus mangrovi]|uniref:AAA family ATPase n=1 Tax=Metabacillus mangrovi TaxID=1491830 RepID=A0A7X2S5P0_9BACI|nr:nuclease-related domain-containing DEAD/DEAH box helicase [Metabacillus mangrovi]MTH53681.1 AAA family ATPase [Metabacillus mangrovi]
MAYTIPETIRSSATAGERLLFAVLKNSLPDDYIVYYEPEILGRHPDFVIIGPDLGLVVLEVKDYTQNTILQVNPDTWMIVNTKGHQTTVKSPLKQARDYMFHISNVLQKDKNLIQTEGPYKFKLKFPTGYGAVFTRLKQDFFVKEGLYSVCEPHLVLTRDEIDPDKEGFSEEHLIEKIMDMFVIPFRLKEPLTKGEIDSIRYHLFPEVRISAEFKAPVPYQDQLLLSLHDIKTMDLHQENLARQIGDKNRLIRGVAGSGKTLILSARAKYLSKQHPDWKILVLCYNISLAQEIKYMIQMKMNEPEDLFDFDPKSQANDMKNIQVFNFHAWLKQELKMKEQQIPLMLKKLAAKETILPSYDAILIDEGQDFEPEWLSLASSLLNPDTQMLLLVEDRAQNIYSRKRSYVQDTGLSFQGRSKILSINYRNTAQIVNFAWDFYRNHSTLKNRVVKGSLEGEEIISPQSTRRKGPEPAIVKCKNLKEEMGFVTKLMKRLHAEKGVPYSEMLVLYRVKRTFNQNIIETIQNELKESAIPSFWLTESADSKRDYEKERGNVIISTIDSSKGLDFQAVFIVNAENMPFALEENKEREVSLLYIGMTRSKDYLSITYSGESEFTKYFDRVKADRLKLRKEKSIIGGSQ